MIASMRCPLPVCSSSPSANSFKSTPCIVAFAGSNRKKSSRLKVKATAAQQEEDFQVLTAIQTRYNNVVIVDTTESRLLLLDSTHNVHSMLNKETKWTDSYWDEFSALPPVVPPGPIAIFGLGGGTAAHLMLDLWPSLQIHGWEIDEILIHLSREYFGLSDLEKQTREGGLLTTHIGDVFSPEAAISGGYAGIVVDLFAEGKVLPELEQAATWLQLSEKLMPGGRFMVNCGAGEGEAVSRDNETWKLNAAIRAMCEAFPGQVNWKKMPKGSGENYMALTGVLPDLSAWSATLPYPLNSSINPWKTCT
ncbi:probable polyamine aminopropyl transferase [Salvia hispanica]|uniref:probable polyamine aminopropyl transferase n=1 Tax=Salvia hispanica TaxID=49212 RepID=UPI002009842C|nr:probable polyamine aminopropyl transferase [Salvia hispanica]